MSALLLRNFLALKLFKEKLEEYLPRMILEGFRVIYVKLDTETFTDLSEPKTNYTYSK